MAHPTRNQHHPAALASLLALATCAAQAQEVQRITISGRLEPAAPSVAGFGEGLPLAQTPLAATAVGETMLRDNGLRSLAELTRLDASLSDAYNAEGYWSFLSVRGFTLDNRYNYRRDGLPINAESAIALGNKDSLEVQKGVTGIQAGTSAPGGLVNFVVKRPERAVRSASVEARQGGGSAVAIDIGERFGNDETFGVRVNAAYEDLKPQTHSADGYRRLAAVAADARLPSGTLIEVEAESSRQQQPSVPGFSLLGDVVLDAKAIDPRTNLNNQAWSQPVVLAGNTASLRITQALAPDWRARLHAMTQRLTNDDRIAFPFGCSDEGRFDRYCSDGSMDLYDYRSDGEQRRSDALDLGIEGRFAVAGTTHHLSTGLLATHFESRPPPQAFNFAGTGRIDGNVPVPAAPLPLTDVASSNERTCATASNSRRAGACGPGCATPACGARSSRASPHRGSRWPGRPSRRRCSTPTGARVSRAKRHPTCRCTPTLRAPCPRCKVGNSKPASSTRARASSFRSPRLRSRGHRAETSAPVTAAMAAAPAPSTAAPCTEASNRNSTRRLARGAGRPAYCCCTRGAMAQPTPH
jgi:outer membrane receptor protein involved in Fe transport